VALQYAAIFSRIMQGTAMSWDLIVFDFPDPMSAPDTGLAIIPDDWMPPSMGSSESVRAKISGALPEVDWTDPSWGNFDGSGFSLEFGMGKEETISSFSIFARGNATQAVLMLVSATGWRILDLSSGKWMHASSNPDEGREAFQSYLHSVIAREVPTRKRSLLSRLFRW
jgi:hypothetical protein